MTLPKVCGRRISSSLAAFERAERLAHDKTRDALAEARKKLGRFDQYKNAGEVNRYIDSLEKNLAEAQASCAKMRDALELVQARHHNEEVLCRADYSFIGQALASNAGKELLERLRITEKNLRQGQESMRERAAKVCESFDNGGDKKAWRQNRNAEAIRALPLDTEAK